MNSSIRRWLMASAALVVAACTGSTDPDITRRLALAQAQARWNTAGIHDYTYDVSIGGSWVRDSVHVVVHSDTITSATSYLNPSGVPHPNTIPAMLAAVRVGLDDGSLSSASFDAHYGYPVRVTGDHHIPDTFYSFGVVRFQPLP